MVTRILLLLVLLAAPAWAEDRLQLVVPASRPVVGEMIPVTIRGEYTGAIALESLEMADSQFYDWIQYAPDRWSNERIDGKPRKVFERRIGVFAKAPGSLIIPPLTHRLSKADGGARTEVEVVSDPVTIPVTAYPGAGRPLAASLLTVTDDLSTDPARLAGDETFVRRITLSAEGTMAHFLPSRPSFDESWLIGFAAPEIRETRLTDRGPLAVVIWEWHLRPRAGETGTLAPLHFPFYNTLARKIVSAVTLPLEVGATAATEGTAGPAPGTRLLGVLMLAGGGLAGAALMLFDRRFAGRGGAGALVRRLRPNPHRAALRTAARAGDPDALRRAARDFAGHERAAGRKVNEAALAELDRAMFAPAGSGAGLDREGFAASLARRGGGGSRAGPGAGAGG